MPTAQEMPPGIYQGTFLRSFLSNMTFSTQEVERKLKITRQTSKIEFLG